MGLHAVSNTRTTVIVKAGYIFILTNFLLAVFNFIVGAISGSIAIISDAIHSLTDTISGGLIIISEKLAKSHRFGHRRASIERVTTVIIALIIVVVGIHIAAESVEKIISPEPVDYSAPTIIVLVASVVAKYALAAYLKRTGKANHSDVLIASGAETMNDTLISVAVLVSALIYITWQIDIEAYVSLVVAVVIMKVGLEFIFPHFSTHHHHPFDQHPDHAVHH